MSEAAADPRLPAYLLDRLRVARRRGRRRAVAGIAGATLLAVAGTLASEALRDPEGVVESLPVHTGRYLQASAVRSLEAGAPSSARAARRQLDRVPSEINAVVSRELSRWADRSADTMVEGTAEHLGLLALEHPDALAQALGLGSAAGAASKERTRSRVRALMTAELRPTLVDEVAPLAEGPTAYLVATANAIEALDDDDASAEQMLEQALLGLLAQLIAPA